MEETLTLRSDVCAAFSGQENSEQDMCMEQHSVPARVRAPCRSAGVPGLVESWAAELGGRGARSGVGPWPSSSLRDGLLLLLGFCFSGKAVGRSAEEQQRSRRWSGWGPSRAVSRPEDGQEGAAQGRMRTKWFLFSFHTLRLHRCIGHPSTEALPGICLLVC